MARPQGWSSKVPPLPSLASANLSSGEARAESSQESRLAPTTPSCLQPGWESPGEQLPCSISASDQNQEVPSLTWEQWHLAAVRSQDLYRDRFPSGDCLDSRTAPFSPQPRSRQMAEDISVPLLALTPTQPFTMLRPCPVPQFPHWAGRVDCCLCRCQVPRPSHAQAQERSRAQGCTWRAALTSSGCAAHTFPPQQVRLAIPGHAR